MVKTRATSHATINLNALREAFGILGKRTLIHRTQTRTLDEDGIISNITTSDTIFQGDLQFGINLDKRALEMGIVEVGEAILYHYPGDLDPRPQPEDLIVNEGSIWEVIHEIEAPDLGGSVVHYSYRCRRVPNTGDSR